MLRITREDMERELFVARGFYVGVRRNWSRGSRAIFVKRILSADTFVGCGTMDKLIEVSNLEESERKLCELNNWYGKILFGFVVKFLPPVGNSAVGLPVLQTGYQIPEAEIDRISAMASTRIIS